MNSKGTANKVILLANVGQDPEVKQTSGGAAVTTLSVATNEVWKDNDGNKQERAEWHRVILWRKLAEIAGEYIKKGSKVYINRGNREGVTVGQTFVVGTVEVIRDPDTGEVLDEDLTEIARLRAEKVKEKLTICSLLSGKVGSIKKGMAVHIP